ncbi:MAG TPA: DUF433 domain-containing protein [Nitrososphaera sp.]|nr:DUF433 domain-containing protein [Nitrososphaera sp.]
MEIAKHISIDPNIHHGAPVITGTRVPVSVVIGSLAGGMSKEDVCREYELSKEAVESALAYAAELVAATEVIPLVGV